ncbi:MAG: 2-C-methyl-D-erythritol 4-phosphate cytidylyltransferase [Hungatella sp.]|nr:2-C-methyl-D-erythritol 4-phosphate cytidylyltransferase [Hungatella sp.]
MNYAIVLAAGVGQRMRNGGLPKQFLKLMGKPIIIYTLEKFEESREIDQVIVVCHGSYIDYMEELLRLYQIKKVTDIIVGGSDRQSSLRRGLNTIVENGGKPEDIVAVHDGVRPLVDLSTIQENIRVARQFGCAITVHPVTETVVVTGAEEAGMADFKKRSDTYSMTAPQTFQLGRLMEAYEKVDQSGEGEIPLLDAAMVYARAGGEVHLVKQQGANIKITTPEDYYFLKAMLELEENKFVFGL